MTCQVLATGANHTVVFGIVCFLGWVGAISWRSLDCLHAQLSLRQPFSEQMALRRKVLWYFIPLSAPQDVLECRVAKQDDELRVCGKSLEGARLKDFQSTSAVSQPVKGESNEWNARKQTTHRRRRGADDWTTISLDFIERKCSVLRTNS